MQGRFLLVYEQIVYTIIKYPAILKGTRDSYGSANSRSYMSHKSYLLDILNKGCNPFHCKANPDHIIPRQDRLFGDLAVFF